MSRNQRVANEWQKHVMVFNELESISKSEYCKTRGLVYHQFLYWYEKYNTVKQTGTSSEWVTIGRSQTGPTTHCEIEFGNGALLKLYSLESLELLKGFVRQFQ